MTRAAERRVMVMRREEIIARLTEAFGPLDAEGSPAARAASDANVRRSLTYAQIADVLTANPSPHAVTTAAARCFSWDWRQQPDMAGIAALVGELSGGQVVMREVDTRSDEYAWVVADREVSGEEAREMYLS